MREALQASPGGLSEDGPLAALRARIQALQQEAEALEVRDWCSRFVDTAHLRGAEQRTLAQRAWHCAGIRTASCYAAKQHALKQMDTALFTQGRAVPRPTPPQYGDLAAEAAAFLSGAGSLDHILALLQGLQVRREAPLLLALAL